MFRQYQGEREQDGSYLGETLKSVLLKAFAQKGVGDISDTQWIHLIHEGTSKKRLEYCLDSKKCLCHLRAIQTLWWYSVKTRDDGIRVCSNWRQYIFHLGISWNLQSILRSGLIPGRKENDRARRAVFFVHLNPPGNETDEEEPHFDYPVPQKVHYRPAYWKRNQDPVYWENVQSAGSRIAILENTMICNHHQRHSARRLH